MKQASKKQKNGFTLLELIVAISIASAALTWALPQFNRRIARSEVQTFTQSIASGFYSLRARQGQDGSGCEIIFESKYNFNKGNTYGAPKDLMEGKAKRLKCCDSAQCWEDDDFSTYSKKPYRYLDFENTKSSKNVEIQVSHDNYTLSPPGTSPLSSPLIIIVRSKKWDQDPERPLPTLCVELSSNGFVRQGKWIEPECT